MEVFDGYFAFFDFFSIADDFLFYIGEGELVAIADDGNHKAFGAPDGDADVVEMVLDNFVAFDLGIDFWDLLEGVDGGFDEEGHEAEFNAVFFKKFVLVFFAGGHDCAHIDFVKGGEHGSFLFGGDESFGDFTTKGRHFFACNAVLGLGGFRCLWASG